jgi:hypothetical protein
LPTIADAMWPNESLTETPMSAWLLHANITILIWKLISKVEIEEEKQNPSDDTYPDPTND